MRHGFVTRAGGIAAAGLALGVVFGLGGCETKVSDKDLKYITSGDVKQMLETRAAKPDHMLLIDPRSAREYGEGHIAGAEHITIDRVSEEKSPRNPPFGRYTHIVVYGNDPASPPAKGMAKRIMKLGYKKNTKVYGGGMQEWADTYPSLVEKAEDAPK